jgi:hypothetical protein
MSYHVPTMTALICVIIYLLKSHGGRKNDNAGYILHNIRQMEKGTTLQNHKQPMADYTRLITSHNNRRGPVLPSTQLQKRRWY